MVVCSARPWLTLLALPALLSPLLAGCASPDRPAETRAHNDRPNVLFIVTDDQRFDMLGVVNPVLETPNMDRLATEGVRFENAFVTTPICAASRASLLSGVVERTHRYTFLTPPLADGFVDNSYPKLLRDAGYHTGFVGKFGVNVEPGAKERMFDVFEAFAAPYMKEQPDGTTRHLTDITTDRAIAFLRSVDASDQFALTVSYNAPHADDGDERQYIWPQAMDAKYVDLVVPAPPLSEPSFFASLPPFLGEKSLNRVRWHWRFDTPEKTERMTKGYYRMISGVDAGIGRILRELQSQGVADNTVVILMGDNGYFLGERGYAGKWLPHELSIRVPLIVFDPRGQGRGGAVPTESVLNIDVPPTILAYAGIEPPTSMQGKSLRPLVEGRVPTDWRHDFFVEHLFDHPEIPKHEGVRGERYKYARYFEQMPVYEELYDLVEDPIEAVNRIDDPSMMNVLQAMRRRTDDLVAEYGGPYVAAVDSAMVQQP